MTLIPLVIAGRLTHWHFAPAESARQNLLSERIDDAQISVTGNTVIDALLSASGNDTPLPVKLDAVKRLVLVTAHRRENFGKPLEKICRAIRTLLRNNPDIVVLYPVHPNPKLRETAYRMLGSDPRARLCERLDYLPFVAAMKRSDLILSDSGGVQEEAPALTKTVLVLREETERPEVVDLGVVELMGPNHDRIVDRTQQLLADEQRYPQMAKGDTPCGDGKAAQRIAALLESVDV